MFFRRTVCCECCESLNFCASCCSCKCACAEKANLENPWRRGNFYDNEVDEAELNSFNSEKHLKHVVDRIHKSNKTRADHIANFEIKRISPTDKVSTILSSAQSHNINEDNQTAISNPSAILNPNKIQTFLIQTLLPSAVSPDDSQFGIELSRSYNFEEKSRCNYCFMTQFLTIWMYTVFASCCFGDSVECCWGALSNENAENSDLYAENSYLNSDIVLSADANDGPTNDDVENVRYFEEVENSSHPGHFQKRIKFDPSLKYLHMRDVKFFADISPDGGIEQLFKSADEKNKLTENAKIRELDLKATESALSYPLSSLSSDLFFKKNSRKSSIFDGNRSSDLTHSSSDWVFQKVNKFENYDQTSEDVSVVSVPPPPPPQSPGSVVSQQTANTSNAEAQSSTTNAPYFPISYFPMTEFKHTLLTYDRLVVRQRRVARWSQNGPPSEVSTGPMSTSLMESPVAPRTESRRPSLLGLIPNELLVPEASESAAAAYSGFFSGNESKDDIKENFRLFREVCAGVIKNATVEFFKDKQDTERKMVNIIYIALENAAGSEFRKNVKHKNVRNPSNNTTQSYTRTNWRAALRESINLNKLHFQPKGFHAGDRRRRQLLETGERSNSRSSGDSGSNRTDGDISRAGIRRPNRKEDLRLYNLLTGCVMNTAREFGLNVSETEIRMVGGDDKVFSR